MKEKIRSPCSLPQKMAGKMDNVVFLKVDVDEAEAVAAEYNISAMPTFVFIKDGKKVQS